MVMITGVVAKYWQTNTMAWLLFYISSWHPAVINNVVGHSCAVGRHAVITRSHDGI